MILATETLLGHVHDRVQISINAPAIEAQSVQPNRFNVAAAM